MVALRTQALKHESDWGGALLDRRIGAVENDHGPRRSGTQSQGLHSRALVGRSLVVKDLALIPALARRARSDELDRTFGFRLESRPCGRDRGFGVSSLRVENGDVRVGLRRRQDDQILAGLDRPAGGDRESGSGCGNPSSVGGDALDGGFGVCRLR